MQERGYTPTVIENAVEHGVPTPQPDRGTIRYWDTSNKFNVVVDADPGRIVSVF
jgi:hypothetical protein